MSIEPITLHHFCSPKDDRFQRPMRLLGGTIATNGKMLVWVPQPYDYDRSAHQETEAALEYLVRKAQDAAREPSGTWRNVADVRPAGGACYLCGGKGEFARRTCEECAGTGSFEHGRWMYTCKECDGDGSSIVKGAHATQKCDNCYGSGLQCAATDFVVERHPNYTANQRLVALLGEITRAQLRQEPIHGKKGLMIPLRFDGGVGVLCPMRGKPLPVIATADAVQGGAA